MKHIKSFKQLNEEVSGDGSPINCNSGACSLHLNFDINKITNSFIYPGVEYTTSAESKNLLKEFAEAIQMYDLNEIGGGNKLRAFFNEEQAYFGGGMGVSCGSNNFSMIEIPKEISRFKEFEHDYLRGDYNSLNEEELKRCKKIDHLEEGKIYVAFSFRDMKNLNNIQYYTGVIDVTEPVKKFIEKSNQGNLQVR
jgi:hypothetical protein